VASGRPAPRYASVGVVCVNAWSIVIETCGIAYGPGTMNSVSCEIAGVRSWRYAPLFCTAWNFSARTLPWSSTAASYDCQWSRPWIVARMFSLRSSIHLTGAPTAFEAAQSRNSSR